MTRRTAAVAMLAGAAAYAALASGIDGLPGAAPAPRVQSSTVWEDGSYTIHISSAGRVATVHGCLVAMPCDDDTPD